MRDECWLWVGGHAHKCGGVEGLRLSDVVCVAVLGRGTQLSSLSLNQSEIGDDGKEVQENGCSVACAWVYMLPGWVQHPSLGPIVLFGNVCQMHRIAAAAVSVVVQVCVLQARLPCPAEQPHTGPQGNTHTTAAATGMCVWGRGEMVGGSVTCMRV